MPAKKPPIGKMPFGKKLPKSNMKEELAEYGAKGKKPIPKKKGRK